MRQQRPEEGSLLTPESPTTITWHILGAGAIGSLWAIYGHRAGADVRPILRDQQTLDAYQQCAGISLHSGEQTLHYQLPASCPTSLSSPIQHLLITTKAQQTLPALKTLNTHITDDAVLLLLQNGLGIAEQIQREFPKATREGGFEVLASGDAEADDALPIRTDAKVAAATLAKGQSAVWNTSGERHQYLVAPKGRVTVNGREAQPRDGIAVTGESEIVVEALDDAEIVLVDAR